MSRGQDSLDPWRLDAREADTFRRLLDPKDSAGSPTLGAARAAYEPHTLSEEGAANLARTPTGSQRGPPG